MLFSIIKIVGDLDLCVGSLNTEQTGKYYNMVKKRNPDLKYYAQYV